MKYFINSIFITIFIFFSSSATSNPWFNGTDIEINISSDKNKSNFNYHFNIYKNGDLELRHNSENTTNGIMLLLSGKHLLIKNIKLENGKETDLMDTGGLMYQLVAKLLGKAMPEGPAYIKSNKSLTITEDNTDISVATTSSGGTYPAPWKATFDLSRSKNTINYKINFIYNIKDNKQNNLLLSGAWNNIEKTILPDKYSLKDFKTYSLGPIQTNNSIGYGVKKTNTKFANIGEFRSSINKQNP